MDIQFIVESSLALAPYVSGYVTKAERSFVWEQISENKSLYSHFFKLGLNCLQTHEVGLHEAFDILLGDHLCQKSDEVMYIDVSQPHKRKRWLKDYSKLLRMAIQTMMMFLMVISLTPIIPSGR